LNAYLLLFFIKNEKFKMKQKKNFDSIQQNNAFKLHKCTFQCEILNLFLYENAWSKRCDQLKSFTLFVRVCLIWQPEQMIHYLSAGVSLGLKLWFFLRHELNNELEQWTFSMNCQFSVSSTEINKYAQTSASQVTVSSFLLFWLLFCISVLNYF
jgi:hypothetical protein